MSKKLKLAILDDDLRVRTLKGYPVSDSGKHIQVVKGGEGHFMPAFNSETYIELPKKILGRTIGWERLYVAKKGAKSCMNFKTEEIPMPDLEQMKISIGSTMLNKLGKPEEPFPSWLIYLILIVVIGTALKVFGVIG